MTLYNELLEVLKKSEYEILSKKESVNTIKSITEKIKFTWYERIDFSKAKKKIVITNLNQLKSLMGKTVYLFWDNAEYPVFKIKLKTVIDYWDDISCLGTRTWIISIAMDFCVEYYDELILGYM